jgi:hypothetical protein
MGISMSIVVNLFLALIDGSRFKKMQFFTVIDCGFWSVFCRICAIVVLWGDLARQVMQIILSVGVRGAFHTVSHGVHV